MTKEELEKEAEESFEQYKVTDEDYVVSPYSDDMGEKMLMFNNEYYAEETYSRFYTQGYLAGAEPREKRIAELEAEVKEWKDKAELWCKTANLKDHNIMINKELEKENAELKAVERMALYSKMSDQLTKAKELLKRCYENYIYLEPLRSEIEQFLSEVKK